MRTMHLHGAIASQTAPATAAVLVPVQKKGRSVLAQSAGGRSSAQKNASEEAAAQASHVKPNGLYFALKSSVGRKSSDDTEDEASPGPSGSASSEEDAGVTMGEDEPSVPKQGSARPTVTGQLYTAKGALSPAPSVAGGVFEATV